MGGALRQLPLRDVRSAAADRVAPMALGPLLFREAAEAAAQDGDVLHVLRVGDATVLLEHAHEYEGRYKKRT